MNINIIYSNMNVYKTESRNTMNANDMQNAHAFPLALAGIGETLKIVGVKAGKGLNQKLMELGVPVGSEVNVVQRGHGGAAVVSRGSVRIALGAGMAQKVMVSIVRSHVGTGEKVAAE